MNFLEERIVKDGIVKEGNVLKVDSFLNHQMDIELFDQIGAEFKKRFADKNINKILTIEASGIGIACIVAKHFHVPVVFAKKTQSINLEGEMYVAEVESFTHKCKNQVIEPLQARRGAGKFVLVARAWISLRMGRLPSIVQATQLPETPSGRPSKSIWEGFSISSNPCPVISNMPSSLVEP